MQIRATAKAGRLRERAATIPREICESIDAVDQDALMHELQTLAECLRAR